MRELAAYTMDQVSPLGKALVLLAYGEKSPGLTWGEYFVLFPDQDCSLRHGVCRMETEDVDRAEEQFEEISEAGWSFEDELLKRAKGEILGAYDEAAEDMPSSMPTPDFPLTDRGVEHFLARALSGECTEAFESIRETTDLPRLSELLDDALGAG